MAKFTNKDLRLKDGQKITWGTGLDVNMWWDDVTQEFKVDSTVSGVDPTETYHLATKQYIDTELATLSGGIVQSHDSLTGLGDDDHTHYTLANGTRDFTGIVSYDSSKTFSSDAQIVDKKYVDDEIDTLEGTLSTVATTGDHGDLTGRDDDDHTLYSKADGTRAFTGTVGGVTPTTSTHLTTKGYVDGEVSNVSGDLATLSGSLSTAAFTGDHGDLTGRDDDDHTIYTKADGTRAFTGTVGGVTPTDGAHLTTKDYVDNLAQGLDWQDSVLDIYNPTGGLPGGPSTGDRYISSATANGWTENYIYEYDGASWDETTISGEGPAAWVEDEDALYVFNGTSWVKFGSTIVHNNTSGKQGGTTDEYYHLTATQHDNLTSTGGVDNADTEHSHDHGALTGRDDDDHTIYTLADGTRAFTGTVEGVTPTVDAHLATKGYVDGEITTVSGYFEGELGSHTHVTIGDGTTYVTADISPNNIKIAPAGSSTGILVDTGYTLFYDKVILDDSDGVQFGSGQIVTEFSTDGTMAGDSNDAVPTEQAVKTYVDAQITTTSGYLSDHGNLDGLGDDDHTQYSLADGTRAFTGVVSGVTPTLDAHLATKGYVDQGGIDRHGRQSISNGASTVVVSFTDIGSTNYTASATLQNTSDSPPSIYPFVISAKTTSSFTVTFAGDMDSANYYLEWIVIED